MVLVFILFYGSIGASCGKRNQEDEIDRCFLPHADIVKQVVEDLQKMVSKLRLRVFGLCQPNIDLAKKRLMPILQHIPYFEEFIAERDLKLSNLGGIHIEPMGIYSKNIKSLEELKDGDEVMILTIPRTAAAPYLLLQAQGLIKLGVIV